MKSLVLLAVLCACGDKHNEPEVTTVNALVPASHKDELDFVMREVDEVSPKQTWSVPAPKTWEVSKDGGRISAPHDKVNGTSASRVGSYITVSTGSCESDCSPTPRAMGSGYQSSMHERDEDVDTRSGRLHKRIQSWSPDAEGGAVYIKVATWASQRPTYRLCQARLQPELADAEKAFESACMLAMLN